MQLPDPQYVPAVELGYLRGTMHTYWIHAKGKVSQASLNLKEKKKKGQIILLYNCCRLRGCTQMVSITQLMGGSFLCCSNFLLNLSLKLFCKFEEGSDRNNLLSFFIIFCLLAFPALLPPDHHQFSQGHLERWGNPEHHAWLSSIQLIPLGLCLWGCPLFNHSCPKSHLPYPHHSSLPTAEMFITVSFASLFFPMLLFHTPSQLQ